MGRVTECIRLDNFRGAVMRASRYEPTLADAMQLLATHYGTKLYCNGTEKVGQAACVEAGLSTLQANQLFLIP